MKNPNQHMRVSVFVASTILLLTSCAPNNDATNTNWSSSVVHTTSGLSKTSVQINNNGNILLVWQETESKVSPDTDKNATLKNTNPDATFQYMDLFTRSTIHSMHYVASSDSWSSDTTITTGFWQKAKVGTLDNQYSNDNSKIVYDEVNPTFDGDLSIAINKNGDALAAWVQLAESTQTTGDAGTQHQIFYSQYTSSSATWSTATEITPPANRVIKNEVKVGLSTDNTAKVVYLALDSSTGKTNVYSANYDGKTFTYTSPPELSDGTSDTKQIRINQLGDSVGVVTWLQSVDTGTSIVDVLYSRWFNSSGWNSAPVSVSSATSTINAYSTSKNTSGDFWAVAEQSSAIGSATNAIIAYHFTGDITSALTNGTWSTGTSIQSGGSTSGMSDAQIAVDGNGNVLATWLDPSDTIFTSGLNLFPSNSIRANSYSKSSGWQVSSFLVTTNTVLKNISTKDEQYGIRFNDVRVASTADNTFIINWQSAPGRINGTASKMYSVTYDSVTNTLSEAALINTNQVLEVTQKDLLVANGNVQLFWTSSNNGKTDFITSKP